jgi:hypothetical protein
MNWILLVILFALLYTGQSSNDDRQFDYLIPTIDKILDRSSDEQHLLKYSNRYGNKKRYIHANNYAHKQNAGYFLVRQPNSQQSNYGNRVKND